MIRTAMVALALGAVVGCSSGSPTIVPPRGSSTPQSTPAGGPSTADGLCGVFGEAMAIAALGGPVAPPTGGDVLPRGNGIYCHYALAGNANVNVEAQLKDMTREEFEALAETLGATTALPGVGEIAFSRPDSSIMGVSGVAVAAWNRGHAVTVSVNRQGDQALLLVAAQAIAAAALATA